MRRVAFAVVSSLLLFASTLHADWPRFLNSTFDGTADSVDLKIDWSADPEVAWTIDVGEGYGLGSVAGDRYFHFDAVDDLERLRAIDVNSGATIWSDSRPLRYRDLFEYENGPRSTPTVAGDRVITLGVDGDLVCRRTDDGAVVWSVDTSRRYGVVQNFFGVGSSPLVLDDLVIVMVGGSPPEDQDLPPMRLDRVIPNGSAAVAFDLADGSSRWTCGDDLASYSSPIRVDIDGKPFVMLFARGGLLLIDPDDGQVRWRWDHRAAKLESVNAMTPIVDGNRVLISECYEVGAALLEFDELGAKAVWQDPPRLRRRQAMRSHWATPIKIGDAVYGCSGRNGPDSDLRCIDWSTGKVRWVDRRRIRSSLTRVGDLLIVLEERGRLEIVRANPDRFDPIATYDFGEETENRPALRFPCWAAPVIVGNRMWVRGDRLVICLNWRLKP